MPMLIKNRIYCCMDCGNKIHKDTALKGLGRCRSCSKQGNRHSNYKDGLTLQKAYCIDCNGPLSKNSKYYGYLRCLKCNRVHLGKLLSSDNHWKWNGGYPKCMECATLLGDYSAIRCNICSNLGELNPNWQGGISTNPYPYAFKIIRPFIIKRDNFTCQNCDMTQEEHLTVYGRDLEVHHIDYNKQNCDGSNLITLCKGCNIRANFNRDYWKELYSNKNIKILN